MENSLRRHGRAHAGGHERTRRARRVIVRTSLVAAALGLGSVALVPSVSGAAATGQAKPFLSRFTTVTNVGSTVPASPKDSA